MTACRRYAWNATPWPTGGALKERRVEVYLGGIRNVLSAGEAEFPVPPGPVRLVVTRPVPRLAPLSWERSDVLTGELATTDTVVLRWRPSLLGDGRTHILAVSQVGGPPLRPLDAGHERWAERLEFLGLFVGIFLGPLLGALASRLGWSLFWMLAAWAGLWLAAGVGVRRRRLARLGRLTRVGPVQPVAATVD